MTINEVSTKVFCINNEDVRCLMDDGHDPLSQKILSGLISYQMRAVECNGKGGKLVPKGFPSS